jgi:thimet oligopeptidase
MNRSTRSTRLVLLALALASASACRQAGKNSYFAKPGYRGDSKPQYKPAAPPPAPAEQPGEKFLTQCRSPLELAKKSVAKIIDNAGVRALDNTVAPFNDATRHINNAGEWAHLHAEVNPDAKIREAARTCEQDVQKFASSLLLDKRLYDALKAVDISAADANTKRYVATTLRDFKRAGVELDDTGRGRVKQIDEEVIKLGQQFTQNLTEDVRKIEVKDPAKLAGLPADYIASHKPDATGTIKITTDYPDYYPFMTFADDDELKKQLYIAFRSRGDAKNEAVLQQVLTLRAEKALLLGFKDWADYESDDKMVRGGKTAQAFLDRVQGLVTRRAKKDYDELLAQAKKANKAATEVTEWQKAYYENQLKREKYSVDATEVRKYFEFARTLAGLLDITSTIYDIKYVEVTTDPRVWNPDVKVYDVMRGTEKLGRIFLDMHPRPGKYKHAAEFPIVDGVKGVQVPEAALICNFPDPAKGPALLDHGEVVTMFHEFGHLMHHIFGGQHAAYVRQSGVATELDFVEAPSQMFEEWAWNHEVLARFAKHNDNGQVITKELVDKMRKADKFGKGAWAAQQLLYSALSLRLHQEPPSKIDQVGMLRTLQKKYSPFAHVEGTKLHASFGHLISYSSMYYTYLWSRVIARDLLTPFEKKGLMATDVSAQYRDKVLGVGGTKDAVDIVKDFLGRPYNYRAFEKYLSEP